MTTDFKLYHKILPWLIIPICLLFVAAFGWSCFATLTKRSGFNGDAYMYYNLSRFQYSTYNFIVALFAFGLVVLQIIFFLTKKPLHLTRIFWAFAIYSGLVILCEIYLQAGFVGKG